MLVVRRVEKAVFQKFQNILEVFPQDKLYFQSAKYWEVARA